jgi:hypothetical protein
MDGGKPALIPMLISYIRIRLPPIINFAFRRRMKPSLSKIPVRPISLKGSVLVSAIRTAYHVRRFLGMEQWRTPMPGHHEDPLRMSFRESLYLGYKYYYRQMLSPEPASGLEAYFAGQTLRPAIPPGFVPHRQATLSAGGDLMTYGCIRKDTCRHLWDEMGDFFFGSDIVVANLETPIDISKPPSATPEVMLDDMYFNGDEPLLDIFNGNGRYRGYDLLSVANNHSLDMGPEGLLNTIGLLTSKGIATTGAARSADALLDVPILERNGIRFAFLAATFSLNKMELPPDKPWLCNHILLNDPDPDLSVLANQATAARARGADIVVAFLHMGCAYQAYPGETIVRNAHRACDEAGIDAIVAGHPHHAQPMELYDSPHTGRQHFIAYSLGDFIAYDIYKLGQLPLILRLTVTKGLTPDGPRTLVTDIQVRPAFMHATIQRGRVSDLRLMDYLRLRDDPVSIIDPREKIHFEELRQFLETYVFLPHQRHVFGLDASA